MSDQNRPAVGATSVTEKDVQITTPDGMADAAFFYPAEGVHPGVIVWADAFGLRPALRDIGKRLAADGYAVLVPNPFYRTGPASTLGLSPATFDRNNPDSMARLRSVMSGLQAPGAAEKDAVAYVAFLDAQPQVDKGRKIGVHGYCMGGALSFRTAGAVPDRIGAVAGFHAGGLATDRPESPHLLLPKIQASIYVGLASNDDEREPEAKDKLREAFAAANIPGEVEVYPALHGWCMSDMLVRDGQAIYNEEQAERAWGKLLELYCSAL